MHLNFSYEKTKRIDDLLSSLTALSKVLKMLPKNPQVEENLRRQSLLKSSLFSAKIEGNRLKLEDLSERSLANSQDHRKLEVFNLLKALKYIRAPSSPQHLSKKLILRLHATALDGLRSDAGKFRQEPSAIFNQAGVAVYLTPPPSQIEGLVQKLIKIATTSSDPPPIKAAVTQYALEKIHPFLDGNGRVGRLLSTVILEKQGFGFNGLASVEKYINEHRDIYYDLLASSSKDITAFIEFFLTGLVEEAEKSINELNHSARGSEEVLLPRRKEILEIIRDHGLVSFDFIKRRFLSVANSTLHFDLKQLEKTGLVKKRGATRGSMYAAN